MQSCSVTRSLDIVCGNLRDYKELAHYHYRDTKLGPYAAIFAIKSSKTFSSLSGAIGVIVYTMPSYGLELRNIATGNFFSGFDKATRLALINKNVRCINRVIIEPRFRGLGLAHRLVRKTMPKMDVPLIEAVAVMGLINPFFEKAGMSSFKAEVPARCVQLAEAFSMVGIEQEDFIDPKKVQAKLEGLGGREANFIELEIRRFLQSYGKRRQMAAGLERTRYILSKLTLRPVYYLWSNPKLELLID